MDASSEPPADSAQAYLRTTFLERIAHELRGPAGVAAGALDEIERVMGAQGDEVRPFFSMARRGLRRILRSADRLQRTAYFEGDAQGGTQATTDLRQLVAAAARDAEELEARRNVQVRVTACEQPCLVVADVPWVRAAVAELVCNAIRFARTNVSVDTRFVDREASVTVTDDGPGFAGPIPRRFEPPFPRAGLGLSLPLVNDVVQAHAGRLSIHDRRSEKSAISGTRVVLALWRHVLPSEAAEHG
ncbi:MAG: sensor histidine kinase [Polyangiaceae bacterium]|jgi:signal transduction histidine kinase